MDEIITKTEDGLLSVLKPIEEEVTEINGKYYIEESKTLLSKSEIREQIRAWEATKENTQAKLQEVDEHVMYLKSLETQADILDIVEEKKVEEIKQAEVIKEEQIEVIEEKI